MDTEADEPRNQEGERVGISNREDRAAAEHEVAERARSGEHNPHHALDNPASDPDPTEHPDPYERRPDPRGPADVDTAADPADPDVAARRDEHPPGPSTSEPHPPRNVESARREGYEE